MAYIVERLTQWRAEELSELTRIAEESFAESGLSMEEELQRPWSRVWVARVAAAQLPVGFLNAWHVADELHILNVATALPHRRCGFGRALLGRALSYAAEQHIRIVLLEVRRSNEAALALYRAFQFSILGLRRGYYGDNGEDAVEMALALDPATGTALPGHDEISL